MSTMIETTLTTIDDRLPIPAGQHAAGLRLLAIFGICTTAFGGDGTSRDLPRSAWQWVVRLPDGTLGSMTHLVTLDPSPRSQVRRLAAALLGEPDLLDSGHLDDGGRLLARSCLLSVRRQWCGDRDRPTVAGAEPLPAGVAPVPVPDPLLWTPKDDPLRLPRWFPPRFMGYANLAVRMDWEARHGRKAVKP